MSVLVLVLPVEVTVREPARFDGDGFESPGEIELFVHEVLFEGLGLELGVGFDRSDEVDLNNDKKKLWKNKIICILSSCIYK